MMKCVKENAIKSSEVAEIQVEVIARAADILGDPHKYRPDSKGDGGSLAALLRRWGSSTAWSRPAVQGGARPGQIAHPGDGQGQGCREPGVRASSRSSNQAR